MYGGGSGAVSSFHFVSMFEGIRKEALLKHASVEYVDEFDFMPKIIFTDEKHNKQGFQAEYFNNATLEGKSFFNQTEKKINYSWAGGTEIKDMSKDKFSVRWTGILQSKETSEYDFTLGGDDGYRMYINDAFVINNWIPGGYRSTDFTKTLQKETNYRIRIEYYQQGGGASVNFVWKNKKDTTDYYANYLNKADLIIACFGHNSDTEGEGSDRSFGLPELDRQMLSSILKVNKPVIGVVSAGGNIEMQEWEPKLDGLLWSWYAGQEGGTAIADVLFGKVNPSGKLPMTFEKKWEDNPAYSSYYDPDGDKHVKYKEGIFIGYRGYDKLKRVVQYPFGFGLSYTEFKVSDLTVSNSDSNGEVTVTSCISNIGKRAGGQVLQVYVGKTEKGIVERPEKELKSFKKIFLQPGKSQSLKFTLPKEAFTYYDIKTKGFVKEPGKYTIMLGFSSREILLKRRIDVY